MMNQPTPWLDVARSHIEQPITAADMARLIAVVYPEMQTYLESRDRDGDCGLFVGYCFTRVGIRPPFYPTHERSFLRAFAWSVWGRPAWRMPGDVVVIDRGGWHHVGFYLGEKGPEAWGLLSATQGANREIKEWYFPSAGCAAVRRP